MMKFLSDYEQIYSRLLNEMHFQVFNLSFNKTAKSNCQTETELKPPDRNNLLTLILNIYWVAINKFSGLRGDNWGGKVPMARGQGDKGVVGFS